MTDEYMGGPVPGNPAGFISGAIGEGVGSTEALDAFRAAGGAIRTQSWYRLYGEVADSIARAPAAAGLDPFALPGADDYATWAMGRGGEYVTSVRVFFRDTESEIIGSKLYDYKTADPHTPIEAQLAAEQDYFSPDNTEVGTSGEGQVFLGSTTHNVYLTTRYVR